MVDIATGEIVSDCVCVCEREEGEMRKRETREDENKGLCIQWNLRIMKELGQPIFSFFEVFFIERYKPIEEYIYIGMISL